ncbi:MAG: hypothetical protein ABDH37_00015 [Candidatus Hydrothermales bacterium]
MTDNLVFVETEKGIKNFFFLSDLNSTFEINPLFEKIIKFYKPYIVVRKELVFKLNKFTKDVYDTFKVDKETYVFDSLFIPYRIPNLKKESLLQCKGKNVGIFIKNGIIKAPFCFEDYGNLDVKEVEGVYIENFYDLPSSVFDFVETVLRFDREYKKVGKNVYIKKGEKFGYFFFDTVEGPIVMENLSEVLHPVTLKGPVFIGNDVKLFRAFIKNSFIKDVVRLGGEVDSTIFYGFSNKAHEGYIGNSVIGKWVNLGALTTTSDLKNTYSEVRIFLENGRVMNTGKIKVGSFISDHVQTGIGTLLSTGTVVMSFVNLYGGLNFKGLIEPFTWWGDDVRTEYKLEKAIEVARKMMERRNVKMEDEYIELIKNFYKKFKNKK